MVKLRSGSTTMTDSTLTMSTDHFVLCFKEALKDSEILDALKVITNPNKQELADMVSGEIYKQLQPLRDELRQRDEVISSLKKNVHSLEQQIDDLEQYSRRESVRIAGIPENENENTDEIVLDVCSSMKLEPMLKPEDISVSHRVGKKDPNRSPRQIIVRFTSRKARERVYRSRTALRDVNRARTGPNATTPGIFINEDLTSRRAKLASKARQMAKDGQFRDTWTYMGNVIVKDQHNRITRINKESDLLSLANRPT